MLKSVASISASITTETEVPVFKLAVWGTTDSSKSGLFAVYMTKYKRITTLLGGATTVATFSEETRCTMEECN